MTIWLLLAFFGFVMGATTLSGYYYLRSQAAAALETTTDRLRRESKPAARESFGNGLAFLGGHIAGRGKSQEDIRKQLFRAGYRSPSSYLVFHGIQLATALVLTLLVVVFVTIAKASLGEALLPALCAGGFGFMVPSRVLEYQMRARAARVRRAVPAALELLVLALDAGQTIDQAMKDTSQSLREIHPDLCSEFVFCHLEMGAGTSRIDSLRRLGERGGDEELRRLAHLLIDGERFGTNLGPALRTHILFLRGRMRQQAQQTARKLGVKLVFPVFFLIFPSVLLVTLGPAYLQLRGFLDTFMK